MKRALLCVQGINNKQGYLYEEILKGEGKWLAEKKDPKTGELYFSYIEDAETDKIFDQTKTKSLFGKTLELISFNQWKRLGDIWHFFRNDLAREKVCKLVGRRISMLQDNGYEVSVIAHSLGNLITMCAKDNERLLRVETFYSLANPMFIKARPFRKGWLGLPGTIPYVAQNRSKFSSNNTIIVWSNTDFVAGKYDSQAYDLIDTITRDPAILKQINIGHSISDYLQSLGTSIE